MKLPIDLYRRKRTVKPAVSNGTGGRKQVTIGYVGRLVFVAVCLVLLLTAAFIYRVAVRDTDNVRAETGNLVAEGIAERVGNFLQLQLNTMEVLAKDPDLADMMVRQPQAQWPAIAQEMGKRFPEAIRIRLLPPGLREADMNAAPPISYSVLEALQLAESGTPPPAEAHLVGAPRQHVNLVRRIDSARSGQVAGHLVASFGLPVLDHLVDDADLRNGYLELQQPTPSGEPLVLATTGDTKWKSGAPLSRLPEVPGSRWHLAYWGDTQTGRLSQHAERVIAITLVAAIIAAAVVLYLLFHWLSGIISGDQAILTAMLDDLQAGRRKRYQPVRLQACRGAMELIRDIAHSGLAANAPAADGNKAEEPLVDPLVESIEPDGGMFGVEEVKIDPAIFRKYDIRGIVETALTPEVVYETGRAIGSAAVACGQDAVVVGRDGRLSGPELVDALAQGLRASGCNVINIGAVPTPVVYFAAYTMDCNSGVMVTGSHNPPEYNGMKIVLAGETLAEDGIQDLYRRILESDLKSGAGRQESVDIVPSYLEYIINDIKLSRPIKVVVDCGNGIAGVVAPQLLRALGCEVTELYCEVDGNFPNHHPDPGKPENLADLIRTVQEQHADIGLAFDGDGDRLGVVSADGSIVWPDRLMMLFAMDVLNRNAGAQIIYDVKCSRHLPKVIKDFGGVPLMWKTGHSLIKSKMKETGALLAGEMSGHIFFKERWFGFDDALYAAARLLEILADDPRGTDAVFSALPDSVNTPEINVTMQEGEPAQFMQRLMETAQFEDAEIATIDGLRADFTDGWGLVRASNTTPSLVLRFEADTPEALEGIQRRFKEAMLAAWPELNLPF